MNYETQLVLTAIAGVLAVGAHIPYMFDILKGRAQPARSTRIMVVLILAIVLVQQRQVGAGLTLAITIGELIGSIAVLGLSLKHGIGGFKKVDVICYVLVAIDIIVWLLSGSAVLALGLSIAADATSFYPTLHKTWLHPKTETPLFYHIANLAIIVNLLAASRLNLAIAAYPLALIVMNSTELLLIHRARLRKIFARRHVEESVRVI